ncbi:FixH family protein [Bacillus massiliglaciei]|uniref:FixH family protein n=1 Tax=Bacillus massiliglaciei TaxID=1816693 RepID=UPI000DA5FB0C|nr:FixH family protein [Bacillus massiliglaciei]
MKKILLIAFVSIILVSACSNEKVEETPQMLNVHLTVNPEKAKPNESISFEAKVTYGAEEVPDADEVSFEIWRANSKNHETIEAKHQENGRYTLKKSFKEEGTYYVYAHVTARSMHNMPKKEFIVGKPSEPESDEGDSAPGAGTNTNE